MIFEFLHDRLKVCSFCDALFEHSKHPVYFKCDNDK